MVNLLDLIIFLKDGTIESHKEGRLEIPLDSIDGFKIETARTYLLHESNMTFLITAVGILSKHLT